MRDGPVFEHLNPRHTPIPGSLFDLNVKSTDKASNWPSVDFYGLRTNKALWKYLEPEHGHWDFKTLDRQVELAQEHGKEILLLLGSTPAWASSRPNESGCCRAGADAGTRAEARNLNDWRNYASTIASRYKGRVRYYELWPDPSQSHFYSGSVAQLIEMNRLAYRAIKEADPGAVVVSPGISDPSYFEKYLAGGGGDAADIIGFHFVIVPRAPELMLPMISIVRSLMVKYGVSQKPLWNTEASWRPGFHDRAILDTAMAPGLKEDQKQAWLARAYILSWASGVSRLYWTTGKRDSTASGEAGGKGTKVPEPNVKIPKSIEASNRPVRPVDASSKTPAGDEGKTGKPGEALLRTIKSGEPVAKTGRLNENVYKGPNSTETAFATVQAWLIGARMHACAMDFDKTWSCTLTRKNGHPAFIAWNTAKKMSFKLPQGWDLIQRSDITGHTQVVRGNGQVSVDCLPALIEKVAAQPE